MPLQVLTMYRCTCSFYISYHAESISYVQYTNITICTKEIAIHSKDFAFTTKVDTLLFSNQLDMLES